jgi:hypothetical protein
VLTSFENSQFNGSIFDVMDTIDPVGPSILGEAFREFCEQNNLDTTDQEALKNALVLYLAQQAAPASDDTCTATEEAFATVSSTEDFAPTCTEDGSRTFTAAFEVDWAETQTKTVTIPAKGHANVT